MHDINRAVQYLKVVGDTLQASEDPIPAGTLYAVMMGHVTLDGFNSMIGVLKRTGLVEESEGHLLRWIGPRLEEQK